MYIIVVGGGKIGYHLAKALLDEGHEVLVLEKSAEQTEFICNQLGSGCAHISCTHNSYFLISL